MKVTLTLLAVALLPLVSAASAVTTARVSYRILVLPTVILALGVILGFTSSWNLQKALDAKKGKPKGKSVNKDAPAIAGIGLFGHYNDANALFSDVIRVTLIVSSLLYAYAVVLLYNQ